MNSWKRHVAQACVLGGSVLVSYAMVRLVEPRMTIGGTTLADVLAIALLMVLTAWLSLWFAVAAVGFVRRWRQPESATAPPSIDDSLPPDSTATPTAILMPVYNENPHQVFAGVEAMRRSIAAAGAASHFHFFLLSDSTDPDVWLAEEQLFRQFGQQNDVGLPRVFYRHRPQNTARKAGNIADFCERWGAAYRYMIVLDADSLMEASTLIEMVRRMEADRRLGILQTPPLPLGESTLLARGQQFVARLCGPMLSTGLAWIAGDGGNYWGHNAIIRVAAFTKYCGMSKLPGAEPLGGEILSHDFVEAALMRRAGYKVRLADDLSGSYEQSPSSLTAYAQRDQRWCQGNLQHARLIASKDIPLSSRFHFLTGVLAYGSSPLLILFLLLSPLAFYTGHYVDGGTTGTIAAGLFCTVLALLFAPRLMGYLLAIRDRRERAGFGGATRLAIGTLVELFLSMLLAPLMMTLHTLFVWSTLSGRVVAWNSQDRSDRGLSWYDAWRNHWWQMAIGVAVTVVTAWLTPTLCMWLLPITAGLMLAVPLAVLVSSQRLGNLVKRLGLLTTPEERHPPAIVRRYRQCLPEVAAKTGEDEMFLEFLRDADAVGDHVELLDVTAARRPAPPEVQHRFTQWLKSPADHRLEREDRWAILCDPHLLAECHVGVWAAP